MATTSIMATADSNNMSILYAERIAVLYFLHRVPKLPSSNSADCSLIENKSDEYLLPFTEERALSRTLAFLSCTRSDPNTIPALGILEHRDQEALSVLLAVNKARFTDGADFLIDSKRGFMEIFAAMPEAV
jgi:hypothetical protein